MLDLRGKTVAVTGASSGIGRALAEEMALHGARVALLARREEQLTDVAQAVRSHGGETLIAPVDVTDRAALEQAFEDITKALGPIDVLIANAGVGYPTPVRNLDPDRVEAMMRVNFLGAVYAINAVLNPMLERGAGHIAAVSSLAAWRGFPLSTTYSASKAALSAWMEGVRIELKGTGVAVTTVHPGFVRTPMTAKNRFPMPFLMGSERAARIIVKGIRAGRSEVNFPWTMSTLMRVVRRLPNAVYDQALSRRSR